MTVWMVRAGAHGEQEQTALQNNIVTVGWNEVPDISKVTDRESLKKLYVSINPNAKGMHLSRMVGQLWDFVKEIKKGDLVALPLKTQSSIAMGRIEGDYEYREVAPNVKHIRQVKRLKTLPRSEFDQDLLYSLGAFSTVCEIKRNDAEDRINSMLGRTIDRKGTGKHPESQQQSRAAEENQAPQDLEQAARDRIVKFIDAKFRGHNLARLIESVLKAQGYVTSNSQPGKDGGIDILAASGALGFNEPKICVQVKSSPSFTDSRVLRELQGSMQRVKATQGLLVSWGGFTRDAIEESRTDFFSIRLWDQGDIIDEIIKSYDKFDSETKTELPLKKIWSLVDEELD